MSDEVLIRVDHVSKKFCRSLKRSLWYGLQDMAAEVNPFRRAQGAANGDHGAGSAALASPNGLRRDEFWAVNDVSFELRRGDCLGLIGPNGAGKTTLLKMLNGLIKPDHGRIEMRGRVGALIALGAGFNPILTGRENVYVNGSVIGLSKREIDEKLEEIITFAELRDSIDAPVASYSSGMQVRLGFAVATIAEPDILLLDEVLAVGDLGFTIKCLNRMASLIKNAAVIFVSHNMQYVAHVCSRVLVLQHGKVSCFLAEVARGIDHYLSQFEPPSRRVSGSGGVALHGIYLGTNAHSPDGDQGLNLEYGQPLLVDLDVALLVPVERLQLRIVVWNSEQRPIAECSSRAALHHVRAGPGAQRIRVEIPDLHLAAGLYSLAFIALDDDSSHILLRIDYAASFRVTNSAYTWSSFYLRGKWEAESI